MLRDEPRELRATGWEIKARICASLTLRVERFYRLGVGRANEPYASQINPFWELCGPIVRASSRSAESSRPLKGRGGGGVRKLGLRKAPYYRKKTIQGRVIEKLDPKYFDPPKIKAIYLFLPDSVIERERSGYPNPHKGK